MFLHQLKVNKLYQVKYNNSESGALDFYKVFDNKEFAEQYNGNFHIYYEKIIWVNEYVKHNDVFLVLKNPELLVTMGVNKIYVTTILTGNKIGNLVGNPIVIADRIDFVPLL